MDEERVRAIVREELRRHFSQPPSMECPVAQPTRHGPPPPSRPALPVSDSSDDDCGDAHPLFGVVDEY
jgi:hypothetical protein